eukprot:107655_1
MPSVFTSNRTMQPLDLVDESDEITAIAIPKSQILRNGRRTKHHSIYHIRIENSNSDDGSHDALQWMVMKRFNDFRAFDEELRSFLNDNHPSTLALLPPLPPKHSKLFTNHLDWGFVEERRLLLQKYIQTICNYPLFRRHELTLNFLQIDHEMDSY